MTILRSREIIPKFPPSKTLEPSTPSMSLSTPPPSTSQSPNPRRSARLASNAREDNKTSFVLPIDNNTKPRVCTCHNSVVDLEVKQDGLDGDDEDQQDTENGVDFDSVGKSADKRKTRGLGSNVKEEITCVQVESSNTNSGKKARVGRDFQDKGSTLDVKASFSKLGSSSASLRRSKRLARQTDSNLDSTSLKIEMDLIVDGENGGSSKTDFDKQTDLDGGETIHFGTLVSPSASGLPNSIEAKGKRKAQVDLNFPPLLDDESDDGILDTSLGGRVTKRKVEERDAAQGKGKQQMVHVIDVDLLEEEDTSLTSNEADAGNVKTRYTREEKGKGALVKENWLSIGMDPVDLELKSEEEHVIENAVSGLSFNDAASALLNFQEKAANQAAEVRGEAARRLMALGTVRTKAGRRREHRERFRDVARGRAAHFARFKSEEEEDGSAASPEGGEELPEANGETEDWPGAFSAIRDRQKNLTRDQSKDQPKINWKPSKDQEQRRLRPKVPSLQEMCLDILAKNAEAIVSLDNVPDVLRNKLTRLLCDSRKMDSHFMDLLARGSPTEICLKDCSWMTEEEMTSILGGCDMEKLMVLQLDLSARCMDDYILRSTLAKSPNRLTALLAISLKGASRITDSGLRSLVASAPALRSINLGQCSLITSAGINTIADSLGSVVRELYLDDCNGIDPKLILPALKKLQHLEVLSVAGIPTVCDSFVCAFSAECGANVKELVLKDCKRLTDSSMKSVAESCPGLRALDLGKLNKLTDLALGYLANGCQSIEVLRLCRNAFSDEAIAAFIEACGETLRELSLNRVNEVGHNTALSLSRHCAQTLLRLDLSFCRMLADEALGLIVDSCSLLKELKLFGCSQITSTFSDGYSNPSVRIIGLKMTPILEHCNMFDPLGAPLRYS